MATLFYVWAATRPATEVRARASRRPRRDPDTGALTPLGLVATYRRAVLPRPPPRAARAVRGERGARRRRSARSRSSPTARCAALGGRPTGGAHPCHLAVMPGGQHLVVANYGSGSVAVHPLDGDGAVGERTDLVEHRGHGPDPERQEGPHAHMVSPDPDGRHARAVDLGADTIYRYLRRRRAAAAGPAVRCAPGPAPGRGTWRAARWLAVRGRRARRHRDRRTGRTRRAGTWSRRLGVVDASTMPACVSVGDRCRPGRRGSCTWPTAAGHDRRLRAWRTVRPTVCH